MNILMVLTSHAELGDTGKKTGFWLEEFAAPYYVLSDAGARITLAAPKGGQPPPDPKSDAPDAQTDDTRRFKGDAAARQALATPEVLSAVDLNAFEAKRLAIRDPQCRFLAVPAIPIPGGCPGGSCIFDGACRPSYGSSQKKGTTHDQAGATGFGSGHLPD